MRVAVTGTTGRVGTALARHFAKTHEVIELPRNVCDLADSASLNDALSRLKCEVLINPAGLTGLEACEDQSKLAMRVNSAAPGKMAEWAAQNGVQFFHFSTDYVFSGETPGLRDEAEPTAPLSVYGRSKLAGERAVLAQPTACVVRVSWVFGPEKPSFTDQIFDAALAGRPLFAVVDKFSLPTYTADLAGWMEILISEARAGIVHACQSGEPVSWHGMATTVVEEMFACGVLQSLPKVSPTLLGDVVSFRAPRPRFTAMRTGRFSREVGITPRPWQEAIRSYIRSRCAPYCRTS